jgi:hypothetical protein
MSSLSRTLFPAAFRHFDDDVYENREPLEDKIRALLNPERKIVLGVDTDLLKDSSSEESSGESSENSESSTDSKIVVRRGHRQRGKHFLSSVKNPRVNGAVKTKRVLMGHVMRRAFRAAVMERHGGSNRVLSRFYNIGLIAPPSASEAVPRRVKRWERHMFRGDPLADVTFSNVRISVIDDASDALHATVVPVGSLEWERASVRAPDIGTVFVLNPFGKDRSSWLRTGSVAMNSLLVRFLRGDFKDVINATSKMVQMVTAVQCFGMAETARRVTDMTERRPTAKSLDRLGTLNPIPYVKTIKSVLKGHVGQSSSFKNHPEWFDPNSLAMQKAIRLFPHQVKLIQSRASSIRGLRVRGRDFRNQVMFILKRAVIHGTDGPVQMTFAPDSAGPAQRAGQITHAGENCGDGLLTLRRHTTLASTGESLTWCSRQDADRTRSRGYVLPSAGTAYRNTSEYKRAVRRGKVLTKAISRVSSRKIRTRLQIGLKKAKRARREAIKAHKAYVLAGGVGTVPSDNDETETETETSGTENDDDDDREDPIRVDDDDDSSIEEEEEPALVLPAAAVIPVPSVPVLRRVLPNRRGTGRAVASRTRSKKRKKKSFRR